jgi:serine/threonine-protein kinase
MERIEGKYEILEKMGEGGMGAVYKVRHRVLDEIRVIKVMRPQLAADEKLRERFLREAKTAIRLRHPNVAQLHDCTVDEQGNAFMVIEYIEGVTLEQLVVEVGTPPIGLSLEIATQSLKALGSLHKKKVVHRDIAPDNLMLSRDDEEEPLVKLIDLGIAKVLEEADGGLTGTGMFIGKLRYSSPEHFRTQEGVSVDARSDLYSLGVVLYELLTGTHPIEGDSMSALIAGHLIHPPLDFAKSDPDGRVPDELRAIVLKSLAKDLGDRFQSAVEFRKALEPLSRSLPVTAEDVDRALSVTPPPTIRFPAVRKSTTQEELDRQFVPGTTPPPQPTQVTPPPVSRGTAPALEEELPPLPPTAEPESTAQVAELTRRVEAHLELGQLAEASKELAEGEASYGSSEQLDALKARVEEARQREERRRQVDELRGEAADLAAKSSLGDALAKLRQALELEPGDTAVKAQIAEIEKAQQAEKDRLREERRRAKSLKADAAALAKRHDYDGALSKLQQAGQIAPDDTAVQAQIADVESARAKAAAVAQAVVLVERLVGSGDLDAAERELDAAIARLGDSAPLEGSKKKIEARRAAERQRQQQEQVRALITQGRELLSSGALEEARARLDEAASLAPDQAEVKALDGDLAAAITARELEHQRQQQEKIRALVVQGGELMSSGDLEGAHSRLDEAASLAPDHTEVKALEVDLDAAVKALDQERQRQEKIREAAQSIGVRIDAGEFDAARKALDKAEQRLPEAETFQPLRERLDRAEQEDRAARILATRQQASALLEDGRVQEAVEEYERALTIDDSDQQTVEALSAARERLRQLEEQRERERALAQALQSVESNLERGRLEQAHKNVLAAISELGETEAMQGLRARVESELAARREREERVSALVEDARGRAAAGEFETALERLREADRIDPENASVTTLIGEVETALRRREEERQRQQQISEMTARIERHLAVGALESARGELDSADKALGETDELARLRQQLEAAEKRAIAEQVERYVGEARQLLEAEQFEAAIAQLKAARDLDPADGTATELLAQCQDAWNAHRQEQKRQQQIAKGVAAIEELLDAGKLAKASRRLASAEERLGPTEALHVLKQRIDEAVAAAPTPPEPKPRRLVVPLVVAAVVVAIIVSVVVVQQRGTEVAPPEIPPEIEPVAAAATATLLVDAVPWGQITAITAADNTPRPVPESAYTPILLSLPPGEYTLTLTHPSRATPVAVLVTLGDGELRSEIVKLGTPEVDSFFRDMGW